MSLRRGPVSFHHKDFEYEVWCREAPLFYRSVDQPAIDEEVEVEGEANRADKTWDSFYAQNSSGANYKMRNYIWTEFSRQFGRHLGHLHIVEVGCGHGSTLLPLVAELGSFCTYHATDVSPVALERLRTVGLPSSSTASLWDIVNPPPEALVKANHICLAVFTLSALHPKNHVTALKNVAATLVEDGGLLLIRDYALHDDTMYKRIGNRLSENFYRRKDGTYAFYFTIAYLKLLASQVGFEVEEADVHTVCNENRKTAETRRRCFIHAVLRIKPAFYSSEERALRRGRNSLFSLLLPTNGKPTLADMVRLDDELTSRNSSRAALSCGGGSSGGGRVVLRGKEANKAVVACWVRACEDASFISSVTSLEISNGCKEGLAALLNGRFVFQNVLELNLRDHRTLVPVTSFIRNYASFPSLSSLNLSGNQVDSRGASSLLDLMHGGALRLKSLNLRGCSLVALGGNASFLALVRAALKSGVEALDVSEDHRLDAEGFLELAAILHTAETLQEIFLDGMTGLATPEIAKAIGKAVAASKSLTGLSLAECRMDDAALAGLAQGLRSPSFPPVSRPGAPRGKNWALNLDHNTFSSVDPLGSLLYGCTDGSGARLVSLSISGARLSVESQHKLAGRIACSSWIQQLDLSNNALSPAFLTTLCCRLRLRWSSAAAAAASKMPHSCLSVLNLSNNGLGHVGVRRLFSLIQEFPCSPLRVLRLAHCLPGEGGLAQLKSFFATQPKFLSLEMSSSDLAGTSHEKDFIQGLTAARVLVELPQRYKIAFLSVLERRKKQFPCFLLPVDCILIIFEFLRIEECQCLFRIV